MRAVPTQKYDASIPCLADSALLGGARMNAAINAAVWVVGKALAPVGDTVLEAWAASAGLGTNFEALTTELFRVQAILHGIRGKEIENPPLELLLQKLRDRAYDADDVLDELDYFRIQDQLYGTSEAADEHAKGCAHNLILNAHHAAKAVGKALCSPICSFVANPCDRQRARGAITSAPHTDQADGEVSGCMPKLTFGVCNTIRAVGKRLPCSSLPHVDDDGNPSGMLVPHGGTHNPPQTMHAEETPKLSFNRVDVSKRMKDIANDLLTMRKELSEIIRTLGPGWSMTPNIAQRRPITTSESIEPKLYGRDHLMNSIIHDITKGKYCSENLTVLPIVGPGGIGKTTLAQHIYQNPEVQNHFEIKVWTCVSLSFDVSKLTAEIVKLIPKVNGETEVGTDAELIGQRLKSKRFLLVLDDMWTYSSEDEWKSLLLPFKKSQVKGNIIMVTTRFPAVAQIVKTTDHTIELEGIEREEFKKFFLELVFGKEQSGKHHPLLETGYKIMNKLKGSPLAAKTVGRLLRNHFDLYYWTRVLESEEWKFQNREDDIMPALKISYDYLHFHLQQCFSCCALFPPDYKFQSKELIQFWIGLDILQSGGQNRKVEDIGLENLNDLVSYGFLKKDGSDKYPYYIIHDLLHELALKVANECLSVDSFNVRNVQIPLSIRHMSIVLDNGRVEMEDFTSELIELSTRLKVQNLRTLVIFGNYHNFSNALSDLLREANALRVLYCKGIDGTTTTTVDLPPLVHLRFLRLGFLSCIPKIFSRFYHLRILADEHHHSAISNVGNLQFLQELKRFEVNKERNGFELKQLGNLIELRDLGIFNLERIDREEEAVEAKLIEKNYLHHLILDWDNRRPNIEPAREELVLEKLQPNRNLQELCIRGHGGPSCPTWMGKKLFALQSLCLDGVYWKVFLSVGQMLSSLQLLIISDCPELSDLSFTDNICYPHTQDGNIDWFPNLQKLEITNCPKVVLLPPIPWTKTLCSVRIKNVGSKIDELVYEKSPSSVKLEIRGKDGLHIIDEKVLAFHNLTDLQLLKTWHCKLLELKYLQMLTSLNHYRVAECQSSDDLIEVRDPLGEHVAIHYDPASGKELAQLFSHLRKLSSLEMWRCSRITRVAVENPQHATTPVSSASISSLKMEDPKSTYHQQQTAAEAEDKEKVDDGLLLLPAHLSDSLRDLCFSECPELSLLVYPLPDKYEAGGVDGAGGQGGLQPLRCLEILIIDGCPKFFSVYEASSSSSWCPFPSSLQILWLLDCGRDCRSVDLWPLITHGQLRELFVLSCPNLFVGLDSIIEAPQDEQMPPSRSSKLQTLGTDDIAGILAAPICALLSSSLTKLAFWWDKEVERFTKEQDEALQLLTSLQEIWFGYCDKLQCLPAGLHRLPNLKTLGITGCPAISSLPKDGLPSSLQVLDVEDCDNEELIQQCRNFVRDHPGVELE
ncbi:hypothetical protein ACP70R_010912 [Stipagrostis hirtigluma subsp. patula]